jgi:hypothetical protein
MAVAVRWLLNNLLGRFALILYGMDAARWYPDASGALSAVYDSDHQVIASRPNLCRRDAKDIVLTKALGDIRECSGTWYPGGLCDGLGIRVILPNHYLSLGDWRLRRVWPAANALSKCSRRDIGALTETIVSDIQKYLVAVARRYPITLNLTSGRDSRMLLACCNGSSLAQIAFHTLPHYSESDLEMASIIAHHFKLPHVVSERPPFDRVLLQGVGWEVGRCFYWQQEDLYGVQPTVELLLGRLRWGHVNNPTVIQVLQSWLDGLPQVPWYTILDLAYIELRLACAHAPAGYSTDQDCLFSAYPMNGRTIFSAMMRLPEEWHFKQMLYRGVLKTWWPELLFFPLHKTHWTGFDRYIALMQYLWNAGRWDQKQKSILLRVATANRKVHRMVLDDVRRLVYKAIPRDNR